MSAREQAVKRASNMSAREQAVESASNEKESTN